jgi:phenolic acid decarboxylase
MQQNPPLFSFGSEEVKSGDLVTWLKLPSDSILNVNNRRLNGLYYAPRWCTSKHWLWVIAQNHMHHLDWEESTKKAHEWYRPGDNTENNTIYTHLSNAWINKEQVIPYDLSVTSNIHWLYKARKLNKELGSQYQQGPYVPFFRIQCPIP